MKYSDIKIIPMPKKVLPEECAGDAFNLRKIDFGITVPEKWRICAEVFCAYAERLYGIHFNFGSSGIRVETAPKLPAENYVLDTRGEILIRASDSRGLEYAFATLLQLLSEEGTVTEAYVEDGPECGYRGIMIDLARKPHTLDEVLCYVDFCYLLKLNRIQLHFSDDQGYMLPSEKFPALPSPGHFNPDEIEKMREYASRRGITIVPEVDLPGHSERILKAYPELFGNENYRDTNPENVICVGKPYVFDCLKELLKEVAEMFPESPWIHIGGDEVGFHAWENCPVCRKYMIEQGIENVKQLYTHVVKRLTDIVIELGRTPMVWEGFSEEGSENLSRKVIVIAWESYYQLADRLLANGFQVINCSWQPLYIVPSRHWQAEEILAWNIYNWQHWWQKSPAHLNPLHVAPNENVLGAQICAWEGNFEEEMSAAKENLAALSERTWTIKRFCEDAQFRGKLKTTLPLLNRIEKSRKLTDAR